MKIAKFLKRLLATEEYDENRLLTGEEMNMIQGIVRLSQRTVKDVMVPRIDTDLISLQSTNGSLIERVSAERHSRIPVYDETIDNVVGILYVKDLLQSITENTPPVLKKIIRKPFFVPDSKRLDSLLREMQKRKVHIAIALDEYGGVSGIVCLEDIIEEIVGDIQDEFDNEREDIQKIGEQNYLCDARVDIGTINEQLKLNISNQENDTLGGFVFNLFGKIPTLGEAVTYDNNEFIIQEMDGHKIKAIKVVLPFPGITEAEKEIRDD